MKTGDILRLPREPLDRIAHGAYEQSEETPSYLIPSFPSPPFF